MDLAVYLLYTVALALQLVGAGLVVLDVRQAQRNLDSFKKKLDEAQTAKDEHIKALAKQSGRSYPGFGGGRIKGPTISPLAFEPIANQLGPSAPIERQALTEFVQSQYAVSKQRRWVGVILLFIGVLAGYAGSMLSVA
ncbi:hypothetical protein [Rhodococcus sp. 1168]|uniref:hypothetical protein n=1 Tax=Rhodococcus sp. 1168 TaxID=2018041 RepID=UPI000F73C0D6|nr:hypothetical protein [Rhodococcus sp. 1168]